MDIPIIFLLYSVVPCLGFPLWIFLHYSWGSLFGVPIQVPLCLRVQADGMMQRSAAQEPLRSHAVDPKPGRLLHVEVKVFLGCC